MGFVFRKAFKEIPSDESKPEGNIAFEIATSPITGLTLKVFPFPSPPYEKEKKSNLRISESPFLSIKIG
jgi:hypothetical protein